MNFRHSISNALLVLALLVITATPACAEVADGSREFVQQLSDRGLFELAEQFCLRQLSWLNNPNERAEWELILSECQQQHAWHMDEDSRTGMIHQSALRLSEFLKSNTPAAEHDIRLRVRQIELIVAAGQMEVIVQSPLSNMSPDAGSNDGGARTRPPVRALSSNTQLILNAIQEAETSSLSLLSQIDEIRKEIDSDVARMARERLRTGLAEMAFAKAQLSPFAERAALLTKADAMTEPLLKAVTDEQLRFQAHRLVTEVLLAQQDFAAFKLRYGSLAAVATSADEKASVAAIRIRSLLRQDQPSEALQEYVNASQNGLALTQELQVLRLQSLLQLMELLSQLDASPERTELEQKTADEFQQLKSKTVQLTSGVWRQRCVRLMEHFDRVQQVGPEAAYTLESAASLVASGNLKGARALLQSLLSGTETRVPRSQAALLIQSGHLAIRLQDWTAAAADIGRAKDFYNKEQERAGAAAADLLLIYVLGQQWKLNTAGGVTEEIYQAALDEHLRLFSDQSTARQAREWRARLWSQSDPQQAAKALLSLAAELPLQDPATDKGAAEAADHLHLLSLAGDLLLASIATHASDVPSSAESSDDWKSLVEIFATECRRAEASLPESGEFLKGLLRTQQTGLILSEKMRSDTDWKMLEARARDGLAALSLKRPEPLDSEPNPSLKRTPSDFATATEHAQEACHALIVLASIRQLADLTQYEPSRSALLSLSIADRMRIAEWLTNQLPFPGSSIPGDAPLARFLIELLSPSKVTPDSDSLTLDLRLRQLQLLQRISPAAGTMTSFDRSLDELLRSELSDAQLTSLIKIINSTSTPDAAKAASQAATSRRFWQTLYKRSKPGDDRWLEASLQLARLAEADGQRKEAAKILAVVSVLHPDWGTPVRKAKADELRERLEKKAP